VTARVSCFGKVVILLEAIAQDVLFHCSSLPDFQKRPDAEKGNLLPKYL
jgi:hypothetical protein